MRHTHFGTLDGDFAATGWELFARTWYWWLAVLISAAVLVSFTPLAAFLWLLGVSNPLGLGILHEVAKAVGMVWVVFPLLACVGLLMLSTAIIRWRIRGARLGDVSLASDLILGDVVEPYVKFVVCFVAWTALFAGTAYVTFLIVRDSGVEWTALAGSQMPLAIAVISLAYLVYMLGLSVVARQTMVRGLWTNQANTAHVVNIAALELALASAAPQGRGLDQGFADLLDAGGI